MPEYRLALPPGLPLGWTTARMGSPLEFGRRAASESFGTEAIVHATDSHLLTVQATSGGKSRSGVIPALLSDPGSTLTIDVKGENYHVTGRRRREMGHIVVTIDPFGIAVSQTEGLNPLDLIGLPGGEPDCDAELLAELLLGEQPISSRDLFLDELEWYAHALRSARQSGQPYCTSAGALISAT